MSQGNTQQERNASLEVIAHSYKLFISRIPLIPLKWRRGLYSSYVHGMSLKAFELYGGQVVPTLCLSKGDSKQFKNTERELHDILEWLPPLTQYKGILRKHISTHRVKCKLKV